MTWRVWRVAILVNRIYSIKPFLLCYLSRNGFTVLEIVINDLGSQDNCNSKIPGLWPSHLEISGLLKRSWIPGFGILGLQSLEVEDDNELLQVLAVMPISVNEFVQTFFESHN